MSNIISISKVIIHSPDIGIDKLSEIASEMADYYLPKNPDSPKNIPLLAKESDFNNLEYPQKKSSKCPNQSTSMIFLKMEASS